MVDTHVHLDDKRYKEGAGAIVAEFQANDINFVVNNSCDYKTMLIGCDLARKHSEVFATVGMHPHDAKSFNDIFVSKMISLAEADRKKVVAVGEVGLDFHYDFSERQTQKDVFAQQIEIADKLNLPLVLHVREAYKETEDILEAQKKYLNNGVLWHCYSGSLEFARQFIKLGHCFAFGGAITFKNANKSEIVRGIPKEQLLAETDCPYMTPEPFRGKTNYPEFVKFVIEKIAEMREESFFETDRTLTQNAKRFFRID